MSAPGRDDLRAAWWAHRACGLARRQLRTSSLSDVQLPCPPALPAEAGRWVRAVLRLRRESCLVRALVRQAWDASHGRPRDLIIGVNAPSRGFRAHAWLEGEVAGGFEELLRHRPPATG